MDLLLTFIEATIGGILGSLAYTYFYNRNRRRS